MEKVLVWFLDHWEMVSSAIVFLITLIIAICRKKPASSIYDLIKSYLASFIPQLIVSVEVPGNGSSKKEAVMKAGLSAVQGKLGRSLTADERSYWELYLSTLIESILATPQKKEALKNEKV